MTSLREVALLRLAAQWVAGPEGTPAEVVRRLGAVQGQDLPGAVTSVALRTASRRRKDVEAALDDAEIVRSWPMRGTLHLLAAADVHWMLDLLAARTLTPLTARWAQLGLSASDADRARELVTAALAGRRRLRRADLLAAIEAGGLTTRGPARLPPARLPGPHGHALPGSDRRRRRAAVRTPRRLGAGASPAAQAGVAR